MIPRLLFLISIAFSLSNCLAGNTKCCEHISTDTISKGFYIERYRTFCGGVFGELTQCYITDSTTFRQKIGSYDEHDFLSINLNDDKIEVYNIQPGLISDTVERKKIAKAGLLTYQHTAKECLSTTPLFGKNTIACDTNFYQASSYKTDDGNYITQIQYKCGNDFLNAFFYTDSARFCVFIGVYKPGDFEGNYSVQQDKDDFDFYNITDRRTRDTTNAKTYLLADLKKGKLINVCNNNEK